MFIYLADNDIKDMELNKHTWSFSTIGGVKRVNLESGTDLLHLSSLDPKLWTALSCPVNGLEIDHRTLELIDTDKDGQIRVPEIIEAVTWITSILKNPDDLLKQETNFPLLAINDKTELGETLLNSAKILLKNLGKENATLLTVEETTNHEKIFVGTAFNGDGIISEDSTSDTDLKKLIHEITKTLGSKTDRGGKEGITRELLNDFITKCQQYAIWDAKRDVNTTDILPFGEKTEEAFQNYNQIKHKIEDYFIRCRLAAFDTQSSVALNLKSEQLEIISTKDLSTCIEEIAAYPLSKINTSKLLVVTSGINPAWENTMADFKLLTIDKLFTDKEAISEQDWDHIKNTFKAYEQWISEKEGHEVEHLGILYIREILSGSYLQQLENLITQDEALEEEANNIILVDKMVRYYRDIFTLLKNFVTFFDFYTPGTKAIFQSGKLYIDQRSCDLCIKVTDMAKHANMVSFSGMFLIYCECSSKSTNEKMTIVAALTNGDIDNIVVGKNALFYDRKGLDWDATVIKIVDNPISIRQAFFSPYRKVSRFIETQINRIATSQEEKVSTDMHKSIEQMPLKVEELKEKKEPTTPFDVGKFVGIFAAIGLAVGAIGTAIASVVTGFMGLVWWKMPLAILGIIVLISGPSMVIAFLKLRKRNLAPILDANGWAINAQAHVNIHFGNMLTQLAELPKGSIINLNDPFTKKERSVIPGLLILLILIGVCLFMLWKFGIFHL